MLVVGLTGNIASGKSTVARLLAGRGASVIDADELARTAVGVGSAGLARIVTRWGPEVLAADGSLDRGALRRRVFGDPGEVAALNAIVHPDVARLRDELLEAARRRGERIVVCDIPLLFEAGLTDDVDVVVLVDAPEDVRLERLTRDRALDAAEARAMIGAQLPALVKRARADLLIENTGGRDALDARVAEVWRALEARAGPATA